MGTLAMARTGTHRVTPKQLRRQSDRTYTETDVRALKRALQIERATRKLYAKRLASIMPSSAWAEFKEVCQALERRCCVPNIIVRLHF